MSGFQPDIKSGRRTPDLQTIQVYGNYRPEELSEILKEIDKKENSNEISKEDIELLNQFKKWKK